MPPPATRPARSGSLPRKLRQIKGYAPLFEAAFGDAAINPHRITEAIAVFERIIVSRKSKFDEFLSGNKRALNNDELKGLHLFRTKARCMNCHNGPLFSDNQFHKTNLPFTDNDDGLYKVTHIEDDKGKFKTPSLRDVMNTAPWMHDGSIKDMAIVLELYRKGSPAADRLLKGFHLGRKENLSHLFAFLNAISSPPMEFKKPVLPQ